MTTTKSPKGKRSRSELILLLVLCFLTVGFMNIYTGRAYPVLIETTANDYLGSFLKGKHPTSAKSENLTAAALLHRRDSNKNDDPRVLPGKLSCAAHGGPPDEVAQQMVYWSDIPSDSLYQSPFLQRQRHEKQRRLYMSFEPDGGGWNNIRMSIETFITLAIAMGRTLVLPPQKKMYLLGKGDNRQRNRFSVADFFPMEAAANDNAALDIITMKEFLETEAMAGNLIDRETGKPSFPPNNRTEWDGEDYDELRFWLRTVTHVPYNWKPGNCLAAFPASGDHKDVVKLEDTMKEIHSEGFKVEHLHGKPAAVNASLKDRLKENLASREDICVYDEKMQQELDIHFMCSHKDRVRYLVHFYAFLFMEDWKEDLWMKRFVRDHLRYTDEIQCAAGRIVGAMRDIARKRDPFGNPNGIFDTFHIRRGDFQFKQTRISAEEIFENTRAELTPNSTIYIATDERDKSFFDPLKKYYDIHFMDEFVEDQLQGVNTNYYGMIDQLVAAQGRIFFGAWWSTFTGYINRIRGYFSQLHKTPGYEDGVLPTTYYYVTLSRKFEMHTYIPIGIGFFHREFPISWRLLNEGISDSIKGLDSEQ